MESRSHIHRLRHRRHDGRALFAAYWPLAGSLWSAPHHPSLYDCFWMRSSVACIFATRHLAVLCDMLPDRHRRQWRGAPRVRAIDLHMFQKRLGTAVAFVMVGAGLGAMILPAVAQAVVTHSGWRIAYVTLGGLALLLGLPLSWKYIVERNVNHTEKSAVEHSGITWQQGARTFTFWIIVAVLFVSSISMNGAITHLSALLTDRGVTPGEAALCASILGGTSVLGRIGTGWLLDRFFGARVAFLVSLITAGGIFLLAYAHSFVGGGISAALIGIGAGGEAAITPYLLTRYFGLRGFSTLYGLTWTFYAAAGASGPVILGRAYDSTASYVSCLVILAAALAIAGFANLLLPKYPRATS